MNDLIKRTISGLLFVIILTASIYINPLCYFALFFIINIIALLEFANMVKALHFKINIPMLILCGSTLFTAGFIDKQENSSVGYLIFLTLTLISGIVELYRKRTHAFQNVAYLIFALFYVTLPFTLLIYIPYQISGEWQPHLVFFPFLLVWINDTFAYLFGVTIGKHKLIERISPKKTWEGAIGGAITTIVIGFFLAQYLIKHIDDLDKVYPPMVTYGGIIIIVVIFGIFGDLIESMFKRSVEIKDSGHIMPGHGGILDRMDSLLYVIPAIYIYLSLLKV